MSYPVMSTSIPWSLIKGGFRKTPHFESVKQPTAGGRGRTAISLQPYATWDFEIDLNLVSGGESCQFSVLQSFLGLFMATAGGAGFFLFTDPNDNSVDASTGDQSLMLNVTPGASLPMGTVGDGVSTQFQLARSIGQGVDILQNTTGATAFVNGAPVSCTVSVTGVVTFAAAPAVNAVLSWQGQFQYLCQFTDDVLKDLARVNKNSGGFLWSCSSVAFESVFI